jgi:hypothetical protein
MASRIAALWSVYHFIALEALTHAIRNKEDANGKLIVVPSHAQIFFKAIQTGIADVDCT